MSTPSADLREQVIQIVAHDSGVAAKRIADSTRLVEDLHLDGDDVHEIVERVATEFAVDVSGYRWYHHAGPEGCNPLWMIAPPWWARKTRIPIRVADLVDAARAGVWTIRYPEHEREP